MRSIVLSLLITFSAISSADLLMTWDIPTEREDGSSLLVSEIEGYVIQVELDEQCLPDIWVQGGSTVEYIYETGRGSYKLQIATKAEQLGSFSAPIFVVDKCLSYNMSGYNRRTGINLCGE